MKTYNKRCELNYEYVAAHTFKIRINRYGGREI
jgi:hypothetical protein